MKNVDSFNFEEESEWIPTKETKSNTCSYRKFAIFCLR